MDIEELLAHRGFVQSLAKSLVFDENKADDIIQDTWTAALTHPPPEEKPLRAWLARVVRNFAKMMYRSESKRREYLKSVQEEKEKPSNGMPSSEDMASRLETSRILIGAVLDLDEPYRSAIMLRFYENLRPREIALRLDRSVETVRTRLRRGLSRLRSRLDRDYRGGRQAWCMALAPVAGVRLVELMRPGLKPIVPAGGGSASSGGVMMISMVKVATILAAVLIGAVLTRYHVFSEENGADESIVVRNESSDGQAEVPGSGHSMGDALGGDEDPSISEKEEVPPKDEDGLTFDSVKGLIFFEGNESEGLELRSVTRFYWNRDGRQREETLEVDEDAAFDAFDARADPPVSRIVIMIAKDGGYLQADFIPAMESVTYRMYGLDDGDEGKAPGNPLNRIESLWKDTRKVKREAARSLGARLIDGAMADGFESTEGVDTDMGLPVTTKRVWIDRKSDLPVEVEVDGGWEKGSMRIRMTDLVWGAGLPDDLFETDAPEGWEVRDLRQDIAGFGSTALKPGVSIRVGLPDGGPAIREDDLLSVMYLSEDLDERGRLKWAVMMRLKPKVADRVESCVGAFHEERISVDLDDEFHVEEPVSKAVVGRSLRIPMGSIGLSPREFEKRFLSEPEDEPEGEDPDREGRTEILYRIDFEDVVTETPEAEEKKVERFVNWIRLALDEPGIEEVSWRSENLLVIRIGDERSTGIDVPWTREAVEGLLNMKVRPFEFMILVPMIREPGQDAVDVDARIRELALFLERLEDTRGGWPPDVDLSSLAFDAVFDGRDVRCMWLPLWERPVMGKSLEESNTLNALRVRSDESDKNVIYRYFRLATVYKDQRWRFTGEDIAQAGKSFDQSRRPAVSFELREERKEDFKDFTRFHIGRRLAIVFDGRILSDPVIHDELPGSGIIYGSEPHGFSTDEQMKLLTALNYAEGDAVSGFEFVESTRK